MTYLGVSYAGETHLCTAIVILHLSVRPLKNSRSEQTDSLYRMQKEVQCSNVPSGIASDTKSMQPLTPGRNHRLSSGCLCRPGDLAYHTQWSHLLITGVASEYQGQGLGGKPLRALIEKIEQAKSPSIWRLQQKETSRCIKD
jgi:hypothetical protein